MEIFSIEAYFFTFYSTLQYINFINDIAGYKQISSRCPFRKYSSLKSLESSGKAVNKYKIL